MSSSEDTTRILDVALQSLRGDGQTEPAIKNAYEAIALIGHASMVAAHFRLVGLGEEHNIESNTDATILPKEWNAHNSTYAFRYAHEQSSTDYLLKFNRLGNNAVVMGLAGEDKATSFDIPVNEYISSSALPVQLQPDQPNDLRAIFVTRDRLEDLMNLFKIHVIQKFTVLSQPKEGVGEARRQRDQQQQQQPEGPQQRDPLREGQAPQPARPSPFEDPLAAAPRRPAPVGDFAPPGFEDEYEMNQPSRGLVMPYGQGNLPRSGDRDLYPQGLGPYDPLRGSFGPASGGGGGMHPTPDDPMFGGSGGQRGGYDPRAPPGSRYDPVGPWDTPPSGRGKGPGGGGFGQGGFGGGFGGGDII
ncbi:hypothetical protein UA08_07266 [Talaromyces atroroseus]|uniref:Uncharacterized protein n=1 Tax=Talaromyces atroroseus TaxID=1441469 RepID=A0A225ATR6_TALAT|nr:hypothetical protein UA08_07266 [Talaromyces atroroseus]OKL57805.1 hypothetical protein UA08_07266 [Talaromyces atroroseus]